MKDSEQYRDVYTTAVTEDVETLEQFWEEDQYEEVTWNTGNRLIRKHIDKSSLLLDLGCGIYPHDDLGPLVRSAGIDASFKSLQVAKERHPTLSLGYLCSNATCLPIRDSAADFVIAVGELWNHLDPEQFTRELVRVLKRGGVAVVDVSMKMCFHNLYLFLGAVLRLQYARDIDRREAWEALRRPFRPASVTWQVAPQRKMAVVLPTSSAVLNVLKRSGLQLVEVVGTTVVSDLVPPPIQDYECKSKLVRHLMTALRRLDERLGGVPLVWRWGGNCFFVVRHP